MAILSTCSILAQVVSASAAPLLPQVAPAIPKPVILPKPVLPVKPVMPTGPHTGALQPKTPPSHGVTTGPSVVSNRPNQEHQPHQPGPKPPGSVPVAHNASPKNGSPNGPKFGGAGPGFDRPHGEHRPDQQIGISGQPGLDPLAGAPATGAPVRPGLPAVAGGAVAATAGIVSASTLANASTTGSKPSPEVPVINGRIGTVAKPTAGDQAKAASTMVGVSPAPASSSNATPMTIIMPSSITVAPAVLLTLAPSSPLPGAVNSPSQSFSGTLTNGTLTLTNGQQVALNTARSGPPVDPLAHDTTYVPIAAPTTLPAGAIAVQYPGPFLNSAKTWRGPGMSLVSVVGTDGKKTFAVGSDPSSGNINTPAQLDNFYTNYYSNYTPSQLQTALNGMKTTDPGYVEAENLQSKFNYQVKAQSAYTAMPLSDLQSIVNTIGSSTGKAVAENVLVTKYVAQYTAEQKAGTLPFTSMGMTAEQVQAFNKVSPPMQFAPIVLEQSDPNTGSSSGSGGPDCDMCYSSSNSQNTGHGAGYMSLNNGNAPSPKFLQAEQAVTGAILGGAAIGGSTYFTVAITIGMISAAMALSV